MIRILISTLMFVVLSSPLRAEVDIQEVTSPGGITAWLVEEHSIPFLAIEIGFKGGTSLDLEGKEGATYLMTGLLEEGTGDLDSAGFLRQSEALAAEFGFDASRDEVSISARVLKENADEALDLLRRALTEPAFNAQAFERVQGQIASIVATRTTDPNDIAADALNALAFPDHPYAITREGTAQTLAALSQADMQIAHDRTMTKDRMIVGVVGDVTAEELGPMLDRLLGDLPDVGADFPAQVEFVADGGVTVIDLDTPQSVALWAHKGIDRHDPDFFAAYVMNHILGGGGQSSRLTEEVRRKRGLTYGVYSYLAPFDLSNYAGGSVSSANDRVAEAIDVIRDEWAKMAETGATEKELGDAKKFLTGAYPLRFDGNGRIANILVGMQQQDLPIDYIAGRNDKVNAVTLEDVQNIANRLLKPEDMRFVVVGQPEGVDPVN